MVCLPVKITADTAASDVSFDPQDHQLIIEGAFVFGMRNLRKPDWTLQYKIWTRMVKEHAARAKMLKGGVSTFIPEVI
jgi:hypothetical protein